MQGLSSPDFSLPKLQVGDISLLLYFFICFISNKHPAIQPQSKTDLGKKKKKKKNPKKNARFLSH